MSKKNHLNLVPDFVHLIACQILFWNHENMNELIIGALFILDTLT